MAFDLSAILAKPKTEIIRAIQSDKQIPLQVKLAIAGALSMMSDTDFTKHAAMVRELVGALSESVRGRKVLDELGIDYCQPCAEAQSQRLAAGQN